MAKYAPSLKKVHARPHMHLVMNKGQKSLKNPYDTVVKKDKMDAKIIPLRVLIFLYNQPIIGFRGNLANLFTDKRMPTSHNENKPTSFQWVGNAIYNIESPIKQTAVMSDITMIGLISFSDIVLDIFYTPIYH